MSMYPRNVVRGAALLLVAVLSSTVAAADSPDDVVVFVNKEVPVTSATPDEIRQMFLGVRASWPGGQRVVCVNASEGTRLREAFRARVLRMTSIEEQRYWEEQKVQGKGQEPASFSNTVKAVFRLKGGIGYGLRSEVKGDVVKIVAVLGR